MITSAPQSSNALFLRTILEEIRVIGTFESLLERIQYYLTARSPPELFSLVFERLEVDFGASDLVRDALSLLWISRRGLSEVCREYSAVDVRT